MKNKLSFHIRYFVAFVVLFIIEVLIALFLRDPFIRPYGGDILVVILVYFFVRIFYRGSKAGLPAYVFLFALLIEILQWFNITQKLHLASDSALTVALGTSFEWWDIVCYLAGSLIIYMFVYRTNVSKLFRFRKR